MSPSGAFFSVLNVNVMFISASAFLARLSADDSGQDLVEYALLTGAVAFGGAVAAPFIGQAIQFVYGAWVGQTNNLWQSPDPTPAP